ncbi:MAG: hypothetical protein ACOWWM_02140 [Desulfobacterales bacterium]|jgi:hypothetical protein
MGKTSTDERHYLFDKPKNVRRLFAFFYTALVLLLVCEFFVQKHPHFPWESWFGFYAVYGFVACVLLVLAAKYILRPLMKRPEDYYD